MRANSAVRHRFLLFQSGPFAKQIPLRPVPGPKRAVLDHNRQQLFVSVTAADSAAVDRSIQEITDRLHLKPTHRQPYRYRRSSLEFEIGHWKPELFAAGIKQITALVGGNPALREAYVKTFDGDIERLISFYSAAEFIEFASRRASRFGEAV